MNFGPGAFRSEGGGGPQGCRVPTHHSVLSGYIPMYPQRPLWTTLPIHCYSTRPCRRAGGASDARGGGCLMWDTMPPPPTNFSLFAGVTAVARVWMERSPFRTDRFPHRRKSRALSIIFRLRTAQPNNDT
eukprot:gene22464-biopygen13273